MSPVVQVNLWGRRIGAVAQVDGDPVASFEYDPAFARSGIEIAPMVMPLSRQVFRFPGLPRTTFHGLPGLLADVLPDRFGNAVINAWLARQGRAPDSFTALDRLCYIGARGMGALTFEPATGPVAATSVPVDVARLTRLASDVLAHRQGMQADMPQADPADGLLDILRVGTSAGGARAKALIAWNRDTGEVRSGQLDAPEGFDHWLLKFDGVSNNRDKELADPQGFGRIEFAYHRMAAAAGVEMMACDLLEEGGRAHFLTRRFDRTADGGRLHMQSLGAMAHLDFNEPTAHSYEQAFLVMRRLDLPMAQVVEQFRRMVFNVVARNHDDHVKNIAFLMDRRGVWRLSPAYDVTWSYNPDGAWTSQHQMSLHDKRRGFTRADLKAVGRVASLKRGLSDRILDEVVDAVKAWPDHAARAGVDPARIEGIMRTHRVDWPR